MMIQTSREGALGTSAANEGKAQTLLNNSRIVRVSPSFGGKDRHSKVRTIRGLRDRRVRLSVPTAIQLYGLQDRLGFNQPSKVVDWLIRAAQHEIDKLPPLEMLQGDHHPCPWIPQTANPNTVSLANGECISNPRNKGKEVALRGGSFLGHRGVVGLENSELINIPYFQWDTTNNGYLPMTILSSYLSAASNKEQEAKQYYGQFLSTTISSQNNIASPNEAFRSL